MSAYKSLYDDRPATIVRHTWYQTHTDFVMLAGQSEVMCKLMPRLETLEHSARKPTAVKSYSEVISHPRPVNKVPVVKQSFACFMCRVPQPVDTRNFMPNQNFVRNGVRPYIIKQ